MDDCGTLDDYPLDFAADQTVTIEPFGSATIAIGGTPMTAYAAIATSFSEILCPDLTGATTWGVWR